MAPIPLPKIDQTITSSMRMVNFGIISKLSYSTHHISNLKSDSHLPKKICVICFIESPLKMIKNTFYFMLKALFVLEIFKFLAWLFSHVAKTVDKKDKVNCLRLLFKVITKREKHYKMRQFLQNAAQQLFYFQMWLHWVITT